jgi:hypothetical protein
MDPTLKGSSHPMLNLNIQRSRSPSGGRFQLAAAEGSHNAPHSEKCLTTCAYRKESSMPRFLIERNFAEELELTKDAVDHVQRINDEAGVKWLFSFLSADKKKTYCLYEAPSAESIRQAAKRANIPADVIIEITRELSPTMFD